MWISELLHTVTKKDTLAVRNPPINANPRRTRIVSYLQWRPPQAPFPSGPLQLVMWRLDGTLASSTPRQ